MNALTQPTTRKMAFASTMTTGIVAYLLIAFGLAWGAWMPLWLLGVSTTSPLFPPAAMVGAFAPALGAIVVRRWITREGFADAGLRLQLRRTWPYYLFAWLWPLLFLAATALAVLFGLPTRQDMTGVIAPSLVSALVMTPVFWGEEFGWRSYLQIRLFSDRPLLAALTTGAIWGVWHYPAALAGIIPYEHGVVSLLLIPWYMIAFSIILGWLRLRTGSVWAPSLAHAGANYVLPELSAALFPTPPGYGDLLLDARGLLVVIPMVVLCAWIVMSGQLKPRTPAPMPKASRVAQGECIISDEPSSLEVFLTVVVGNLFSGIYKDYVDRLGLKGNERVLDFGCGSGSPARFLAQALARGEGSLTCADISRVWMQVAQRRLRQYRNIEFKLGDIGTLDLLNATYDVVFVHFVLHDIEAQERPRIVGHLALKLKEDGKVFIREPLRFISQDEIRQLMHRSGLVETAAQVAPVPTQGLAYEGVYCKAPSGDPRV